MQNGTAVQAAVTPQELVLFLARGPGQGAAGSWEWGGGVRWNTGQERAGKGDPLIRCLNCLRSGLTLKLHVCGTDPKQHGNGFEN